MERTFVFVSDTSDSDSDAEVLFETLPRNAGSHGQSLRTANGEAGGESSSAAAREVQQKDGSKHTAGHSRKNKSGRCKHLEVTNGQTLDEKIQEVAYNQNRSKILFQLVCSSAVVMLQMQAGMSWFWNSLLLNVTEISNQSIVMWSFVIGYLLSCVGNVFFSDRLPYKWTLALGCFVSLVFSAARVIPILGLVTVAAFVFGLTMTPFLGAATSQITRLADAYEGYHGDKFKTALSHFIGVFIAWQSFSPAWFAILHSVIGISNDQSMDLHKPESCGFDFIWDWSLSNPAMRKDGIAPNHYGMQPLLATCIVSAMGGIIISVLVLTELPLPSFYQDTLSWKRVKDSKFLLVFPVAFNSGGFQVFCYTIFLQAFVSCSFSVPDMFYVAICIGLGSAASSYPWAWLGHKMGRARLLVIGHVLEVLLLLAVFMGGFSLPYPAFYMIGFIMGIVDGLIQTQTSNCLASVFRTNVNMCFNIVHLAKATCVLIIFVVARYYGENSLICLITIAMAVTATICHIVLEIEVGLSNRETETSGENGGAYVLLGQPKWLPEVNPVQVNQDRVTDLLPKLPLPDTVEYTAMDGRDKS